MMNLEQLLGGGLTMPAPGQDTMAMDTAEVVHISSLALLKMLKHGRAGVPMEVMGLLLGEFVDDYTVRVVDVFAMPQSGTSVSVESMDSVFQVAMTNMLAQTNRHEFVVGWYHSHPGFGCWFSNLDITTQQYFEKTHKRAVGIVIDPIQSVKGKVVIDAFRLISSQSMLSQQEPRQTTSNVGHLNKPSVVSLIHGLNRYYYSIVINYHKNELEQKMLLNLRKQAWTGGLALKDFSTHSGDNESMMRSVVSLTESYAKSVQEELVLTPEQLKIRHVGRQDPKRHLRDRTEAMVATNIAQSLGSMINKDTF